MKLVSGRAAFRINVAGFTYIGLLIAVVILGLALSVVGNVWRTHAQRGREQELLFIGREFQSAIRAYYSSNAAGLHQYPAAIEDLLEDKRGTEPRHYLRRLYADPMTGVADWTLLRADTLGLPGLTGIVGVASSSHELPLKKAHFSADETEFADATCYCDWKFVYVPRMGRRKISAVPAAAD